MKLNFPERMIAVTVLPKESNYVTIRVIRTLISKLSVSAEETKEFAIAQNGDAVTWNQNGFVEKEIEMNEIEIGLIRQQLKDLDSKNKLVPETISLYEKFCT
jgi:hypothetical protein